MATHLVGNTARVPLEYGLAECCYCQCLEGSDLAEHCESSWQSPDLPVEADVL